MKLEAEILVRQYYEQEPKDFSDFDFQEFKKICYTPFDFVKEQMSNDDLPVIRLKYFGTFLVYPKRASGMLKILEERYKFNKVSRDEFLRIKEMIKKFLKNES